MPSSAERAPAARAAVSMLFRFVRISASGTPRKPSLAPSSTITSAGRCSASSLGRRARPPEVVSPLMLALTTWCGEPLSCKRCSSRCTQPASGAMRCAEDSESPSTRTGPADEMDGAACAEKAPAIDSRMTRNGLSMTKQNDEIVIRADKVSKSVDGPDGRLTILDDVGFTLARGDSLAIVGASGSGKTTLLGLLAGLDRPSSGKIVLAGERLDALDEEARARLRRRRVGFVFQNFHLLPALNAEENVMLPLDLEGSADARTRAGEALARVGLGARRHHYPAQLSGGEQQRVALARAFVHAPEILFADEPTGNLDRRTGAAIGDLLFALNREHGTTLVLVTHDTALAERCARRLALDGGRIVDAAVA